MANGDSWEWSMENHQPKWYSSMERFKRELIKKPGCCKKHFSLTKEKRELPKTAWLRL